MTKPLSEMLEEIDVESADRMALRNDLEKMRRVAVELADNNSDLLTFLYGLVSDLGCDADNDGHSLHCCHCLCEGYIESTKKSIARAKDIIGEGK